MAKGKDKLMKDWQVCVLKDMSIGRAKRGTRSFCFHVICFFCFAWLLTCKIFYEFLLHVPTTDKPNTWKTDMVHVHGRRKNCYHNFPFPQKWNNYFTFGEFFFDKAQVGTYIHVFHRSHVINPSSSFFRLYKSLYMISALVSDVASHCLNMLVL